jgi:hypothetical protein
MARFTRHGSRLLPKIVTGAWHATAGFRPRNSFVSHKVVWFYPFSKLLYPERCDSGVARVGF